MVTFGRSHATIPYDRGSTLRFADLCSARLLLGRRAIERGFSNPDNDDDDDNSDDDDVSDDNDGDNVADDDAGEGAMPDMDCAAVPKMNTSLVAISGIVGAVGGAKENAE